MDAQQTLFFYLASKDIGVRNSLFEIPWKIVTPGPNLIKLWRLFLSKKGKNYSNTKETEISQWRLL